MTQLRDIRGDGGDVGISPDLQASLRHCREFPSPPSIAARVLDLAQDPEAELSQLADVISIDPALSSKVLRIANSTLYSRRRKSHNVRQALSLLGMNAAVSLALSFSLARVIEGKSDSGLDVGYLWKRSLLSATCARQLGETLRRSDLEELFLAGLLQCIGMLALDRLDPGIYAAQPDAQYRARESAEAERARIGADHAAVGAWMLRSWGLPEELCRAVGLGLSLDTDPSLARREPFAACAAIAAQLAEWWLADPNSGPDIERLAERFREHLGLTSSEFERALGCMRDQIPDTENVFETTLVEPGRADMLLEEARELLLVRTLQSTAENRALRGAAEVLESRTRELEQVRWRDDLTGVFNRGRLDELLQIEFAASVERGWPLTVLFIDLDNFKWINDTHGHLFGDGVLRKAAELLRQSTRERDIVGRYGGEEFLIVLPGHDVSAGKVVGGRVLESFQQTRFHPDDAEPFAVTASVGIAAQDSQRPFADVRALLAAADAALYQSKRAGRNRYTVAADPTPG